MERRVGRGENPALALAAPGGGLRAAVHAAAGARPPGVDPAAVRPDRAGGRVGLGRSPGGGHRRRSEQVRHQCRRPTGLQRLVADVSLDRVGLILGVQMSRLARSCAAWYQLLEVCAVFSTLLADLDGVYDPSQFNDRLLLGLKGAMSEAELHLMQQRLRQGLLAKARRGELALVPPLGYVRRPDGGLVLDPDEQVVYVGPKCPVVSEQSDRPFRRKVTSRFG